MSSSNSIENQFTNIINNDDDECGSSNITTIASSNVISKPNPSNNIDYAFYTCLLIPPTLFMMSTIALTVITLKSGK